MGEKRKSTEDGSSSALKHARASATSTDLSEDPLLSPIRNFLSASRSSGTSRGKSRLETRKKAPRRNKVRRDSQPSRANSAGDGSKGETIDSMNGVEGLIMPPPPPNEGVVLELSWLWSGHDSLISQRDVKPTSP